MVARSFDGPAGQMEDSDTAGLRRHPSQPEIGSDSISGSAQRGLPITSGLNLLTIGGAIGRDYRSPLKPIKASKPNPSGRADSSSKPVPNSRVPRYNLKTIPPKSPNPVGKHLRAAAQHVPGSYRSEVVSTPAGSVGISTPTLDNKSVSEDPHSTGEPSYFALSPEAPSDAVESLKHATAHSISNDPSPMRDMPSSITPADQARDVQPAEPVSTLGMNHKHSHDGSAATSSPVKEVSDPAQRDTPSDFVNEYVQNNTVPPAMGSTSSFNGPQISELLSQLPPIAQVTTDQFHGQHLTAKPSIESMHSMNGSHSEHSEQISLSKADNGPVSKHSSLLPGSTQSVLSLGEKHPEAVANQYKIHQHRSMDVLSNVSQKLSSVGKSISALSERSFRSDPKTPSLHCSEKQEKTDLASGGPKQRWMRQMLAKGSGSATPVRHSNLTARISQRHRVEAAKQQRRASIGIDPLPTANTDEVLFALQQQKNTESFTRVIFDLESLLKEALVIAHQAAGKDHSDDGHALGQDSDNSSAFTLQVGDGSSTTSEGEDEEDNNTTFPKRLPLKSSTFHVRKMEEERTDVNNGLSENSRPQVVERMYEMQGQSSQGGSERSKIMVYELLPPKHSPSSLNGYSSHDWAYQLGKRDNEDSDSLSLPRQPVASQIPTQEHRMSLVRTRKEAPSIASGENVRNTVSARQAPMIQPRISSLGLNSQARRKEETHPQKIQEIRSSDEDSSDDSYIAIFDAPGLRHHAAPQGRVSNEPQGRSGNAPGQRPPRHDTIMPLPDRNDQPEDTRHQDQSATGDNISLTNRHHFSIREPRGFSLSRSHRRAPIARDWSTPRKRYVASVACISTALMGLIIGIYAGEVPAIQYALVDEHHYTILGNVVFFIGLAISTALFWPLPLLHGRKPYTLAALAILLPLQFPQALAVGTQRSPYVASYRVGLLLARAISGLIMGFANINFKSTLLDLFGASLQSVHPHQEIVNVNDVRRHGGGMGVWLGIWTWCYIGSLGVGFLIGAVIISGLSVSWGFWITIVLIAAVLVLNVLVPEVRRSAYRRSMAEVRTGTDVSRRVARGEVKMHLQSTGPIWWWEEVWAGHVLCIRMLKQPGFVVLSLYLGWIYGQVVMVIVVC